MNLVFYLKHRLRRYIFPTEELIRLLVSHLPSSSVQILDVGCGSGWFLQRVLECAPAGSCGVGVEVDSRHFITQILSNGNHLCIQGPDELDSSRNFDFILFNDVLHHVPDKKAFTLGYLKRLSPGGYVFIKDMSPEHFICTKWNRLHDKLLSGDSITEISPHEIEDFLSPDFDRLCFSRRRIFLYDHFWCLFKKRV